MIIHQDDLHGFHPAPLSPDGQAPKKPPAIGVGAKDRFPMASPIHHMIAPIRHDHSGLPRHREALSKRPSTIRYYDWSRLPSLELPPTGIDSIVVDATHNW